MKYLVLLILVVSFKSQAVNLKVSEMPLLSQTSWASNDVFMVGDLSAGVSKKTTVADFDGRYVLQSNFNSSFDTRLSTKSTADLVDSSNRRYITDANLVVLNNTSGVNTGDQNLAPYFLSANFNSSFDTRLGLKTSDNLAQGSTNLYATSAEKAYWNAKEETGVASTLDAAHVAHTDPHPQYALDSDLAVTLAGVTAIPTGSATSTTSNTATSTTFVELMTSTVVLSQPNIIHGVSIANITSATATSVAGVRVVVETPEISLFTAVADISSSLNNTYFTFVKTSGSFYVWYNVGGAGVDPAPGGTGIVVAIAVNATAATVASATITALSTHGGAAVVGNTSQFTITNLIGGVVVDSAVGTSGFTELTTQQGVATSNGTNHNLSIGNITDTFTATAQHFYTAPSAGTFFVKAQMQRVSGTGTTTFVRGSIFGQGQQATVNPYNPSRIIYVAKNGSDSNDGTWSKPVLTISRAVTLAQAYPSDFNTPVAILVAPGNGTTTYSDTSPVTISKGGISIIGMGGQTFKPVMIGYSGSFIVNMVGSNLFLNITGMEINAPVGANWNSQPSAIYVTGSASQRIHLTGMVVNTNTTTRHALYCDNASATIVVTRSELKAGTSTGPNLVAVNMQAGNLIAYDTSIADRKSSNSGVGLTLANSATSTFWGGDIAGQVNKASNTSAFLGYNGVLISSGVNPSIVTQASVGAGQVSLINSVLVSTATYAITGSETLNIGNVSYTNTYALDPLLAKTIFKSDFNQKFISTLDANWATTVPETVNDAINRMATLLKTLNGGTAIP